MNKRRQSEYSALITFIFVLILTPLVTVIIFLLFIFWYAPNEKQLWNAEKGNVIELYSWIDRSFLKFNTESESKGKINNKIDPFGNLEKNKIILPAMVEEKWDSIRDSSYRSTNLQTIVGAGIGLVSALVAIFLALTSLRVSRQVKDIEINRDLRLIYENSTKEIILFEEHFLICKDRSEEVFTRFYNLVLADDLLLDRVFVNNGVLDCRPKSEDENAVSARPDEEQISTEKDKHLFTPVLPCVITGEIIKDLRIHVILKEEINELIDNIEKLIIKYNSDVMMLGLRNSVSMNSIAFRLMKDQTQQNYLLELIGIELFDLLRAELSGKLQPFSGDFSRIQHFLADIFFIRLFSFICFDPTLILSNIEKMSFSRTATVAKLSQYLVEIGVAESDRENYLQTIAGTRNHFFDRLLARLQNRIANIGRIGYLQDLKNSHSIVTHWNVDDLIEDGHQQIPAFHHALILKNKLLELLQEINQDLLEVHVSQKLCVDLLNIAAFDFCLMSVLPEKTKGASKIQFSNASYNYAESLKGYLMGASPDEINNTFKGFSQDLGGMLIDTAIFRSKRYKFSRSMDALHAYENFLDVATSFLKYLTQKPSIVIRPESGYSYLDEIFSGIDVCDRFSLKCLRIHGYKIKYHNLIEEYRFLEYIFSFAYFNGLESTQNFKFFLDEIAECAILKGLILRPSVLSKRF